MRFSTEIAKIHFPDFKILLPADRKLPQNQRQICLFFMWFPKTPVQKHILGADLLPGQDQG